MQKIRDIFKNDLRKKQYIIRTASLILALLIIFVFFYIRDYGGQTFIYGRDAFHLSKVSKTSITLRSDGGEDLVFTRESTISITVKYKGKLVRYGVGYGELSGFGYTFSDGTRAPDTYSSDFTAEQHREVQLITELRDYFDNVSLKYKYPFYYVLMLIAAILVVFYSMYCFMYPEEHWENSFYRRLYVSGGEPTDFVLFMGKAASVLYIILTLLFVLVFITK